MNKKSTIKKTFVALLMAGFSFLSFGQTIFSEDFEGALDGGTGLPTGWTETGLSSDGIYSVGTDVEANAAGYWPVPAHTMFAQTNDDVCNCDKSADRLILPAQDLSSYTGAARLIFSAVADNEYTGIFTVEVSTDGGTNWNVINTLTPTSAAYTWQEALEANLSAYLGQSNVLVSFLFNDETNWSTGFAIDDVSIVIVPAVTDLETTSITNLNQYTIKPDFFGSTDLPISAVVTNVGDLNIPNYTVVSTVYLDPDYATPLQSFTSNGTNLAPTSSNTFNQGTYSTSGLGTYVVVTNIICAGDLNTTNDSLFNYFVVSENEFARDLGNTNGAALGIGLGQVAVIGQTFDITQAAVLDSVLFAVAPTVVGGNVSVRISSVVAGLPSTTYTGISQDITIDQALVDFVNTNGLAVFSIPVTDLTGNPLTLTPGNYFIGVRQSIDADNMGLQYSDGNVTSGTSFGSLDDAAFFDLEPNFYQTPIIRAYVTASQTTPLITSSNPTNTFCQGEDLLLTSSEASGNQWNLNGNPIVGETNQTLLVDAAGTYTVTVGGMTSLDEVVTVNALPLVNAGSDMEICIGASATLSGSGAVTYAWDNGVSDGVSFMPAATMTYTVTGTDANSCMNSDAVQVVVNALPTVNAGSDMMVCAGSTVTLSGSGAISYSWDNGVNDGVDFMPVSTMTYQVIGTDGNGCTDNDDVMITVNALPTVNAGADMTICAGAVIDLTATGAVTYTWSNGLANGDSFAPTSTDTYIATGTDANGCMDTDDRMVIVNALPSITQGVVTSPSACTLLDGSIDITGSTAGMLTWSGTASGSVIAMVYPQAISGLGAGNYSVTLTDMNGCVSDVFNTSISDPGVTSPIISADGPTTFCEGGSVNLTADVANGITWTTNETTQMINVTTSGSYSVTFVNGACSAVSNSIDVVVNPTPTTSLLASSNPTTCLGTDGMITISHSSDGTISWNGTSSGMMNVTGFSSTISNLTAGTYDINFTSLDGCMALPIASTSLVDPVVTTPTITAIGSTTFCEGSSVTLMSSEATGNVWTTGETTQSIVVSTAGDYSVIYTNLGCSASSMITSVMVNANPIISQGITTNPSVCAALDGSFEILGSTSGNIMWVGTTSGSLLGVSLPQTIPNLGAGSYFAAITDANGCQSNVISANITDPGVITPFITPNGATTFCDGGSVTLSSSETSGNQWYLNGTILDGETNQTITATANAVYTVSVTSGACTASSTPILIVVNAIPDVTVTNSSNPTICAGNDGMVMVSTSNDGMLSWTGTSSGSMNTSNLAAFVGGLTAGSYDFSFTSLEGCAASSFNVTLSDPGVTTPTVSVNGSTTFCEGGSVNLTADVADSYLWSNGATTPSIDVTTAGSYSVVTTTAGCSAGSSSTMVTVNANPTVNAGANQAVCVGGSVVLMGTGALTHIWDNGVIDGMPFVPAATTTYTVTGIDMNGCTANDQVTVTVNALPNVPTISMSSDPALCTGESITLTSSAANGVEWSTGETTQSITVNAAGDYSVTKTNANGCTSTSAIVSVSVNANPTVGAGNDQSVCDNSSVTLSGSGAVSYTWSNGVTNGQAFTATNTTTYTVTGTDANGCMDTDQVTVTILALPTVNAGANQSVCPGTSVTLSGSGAQTYTWNNGVINNQAFVATTTTTYTVTGTAANGCTDTDNVTVTMKNVPTVNAGPDQTICFGTEITLSGSGASTYTWDNGVINNQAFTPADTLTYTFTVTGTASNGCNDTDVVTVIVDNCESINEENLSSLKVYPNPTSGLLTISADDFNDYSSISVQDQLGRVVVSPIEITSNTLSVDLSHLSVGTYLVVLSSTSNNKVIQVQVNK